MVDEQPDERLIFLALWASDLDRSVAFYRGVLGVPLHDSHNDPVEDPVVNGWLEGRHHAYSWTDGAYLHFALFPARGDRPPTTGAEISFASDDADAKHAELVEAGVEVIHPPVTWEAEGLRMARYRDPDGNAVAFTQRV